MSLRGGGDDPSHGIRVYYSSVSGSREVKQHQTEVLRILDGNRTPYELVDVSISDLVLQEMRKKAGDPEAVPPQIFNGEQYCGDFQKLFEATENKEVLKFLKGPSVKLPEPKKSKSHLASGP
ncbi:SH3 domain-binding glutamic acid-rich-like protein 3 [Tachyglossus aculeatus]|uniref:SH3 domain-binding glutamic acid-rich-like protein 3 n=1 Tax=Tachyglossus aculeatus TaxID=9261 RepID=UPI0018F6E409|nr:SH3 domain-binding glutamic acid-rich-like protein 3 [Tachyglossus aculeatus]